MRKQLAKLTKSLITVLVVVVVFLVFLPTVVSSFSYGLLPGLFSVVVIGGLSGILGLLSWLLTSSLLKVRGLRRLDVDV